MVARGAGEKLCDALWFLIFAVASSVWCLGAARQVGGTFDEPVYLERGLEHWRTGSAAGLIRMGTMPLPVDVDTLPLYLWERWHGVAIVPERDWEMILPWARAGTLVFWWLLLFYGWRSGRLLAGAWGGRAALAVLACEPNLLAHASLATTDIALCACVLAFIYHFRVGRDAGWLGRVALPAFWFGLAVLAKASGLVYGGICMVVLELERLAREGHFTRDPALSRRAWLRRIWMQTKSVRRDIVQIVALGFMLVFFYCGCDWRSEPSLVEWSRALPAGALHDLAVWVADHLRIFSNAGEGIVRQIKHNMHGHGVYLLGRSDLRSFWYYFPVLLTIKLAVPLLLAPVLLLVVRPRSLTNWACLAAAVLVVFSLTWHVQIGIRLVLPVVVLGIVGVTAALVSAAETSCVAWKRLALSTGGIAGLTWMAGAALTVWPNGLCYVNEFWGGTRRGYELVTDANYDWGQGLPELARWEQQRGLDSLDVWYFGTDPTLARLPLHPLNLHALPIRKPEDVLAYVRGHFLAVGTTLCYGAPPACAAHAHSRAFLATRRPVARTTTFLIYDFTHENQVGLRFEIAD